MGNPYAQVVLTYVRRPRFLFASVLNLAIAGLFIIAVSGDDGAFLSIARFMGVMAVAQVDAVLLNHITEQFAGPQAKLMPSFRRIHALVAAVMAAVATIVLPAMLSLVMGLSAVGTVSIAVFLFGSVLSWRLLPSTRLKWLASASCLLLFTEPVGRGIDRLVTGQYGAEAILLLVFGVGMSVMGGVRLVRRTGAIPVRLRPVQRVRNQEWQMPEKYGAGWISLLPEWLVDRKIAKLTYHAHHAPASRWSRMRRWQIGILSDWLIWFAMAVAMLWIHVVNSGLPHRLPNVCIIESMLYCFTVFPAMMAVAHAFSRIPAINHELLLPLDRRSYLRQIGTTAALNHFLIWAGASIGIVAWWLLTASEPLQLPLLTTTVACSAVYQLWVFGAVVWMAKRPSRPVIMSGCLAIVILQIPLSSATRVSTHMSDSLHESPVPFNSEVVLWALLAALPALLVVYLGYRRWLVADLD